MTELVLSNDHGRVVISPLAGATVRSLSVKSAGGEMRELLTGGEGPFDPFKAPQGTGSFIMAPWPSRMTNAVLFANSRTYQLVPNRGQHGHHGFVRERPWTVVESTATRAVFEQSLTYPWPLPGKAVYEAVLDGPSFKETLTFSSGGKSRYPIGFGWHPWFRRDIGTGELTVQSPGQLTDWEISDGAPTGKQVPVPEDLDLRSGRNPAPGAFNNCFSISPESRVTVAWPDSISLEILSSKEVSKLAVYSPEGSVCVEPWSCVSDGFRLAAQGVPDTGVQHVVPGAPVTGWTRWSWG
ncbi:MAG: hypothetical protein FJ319_06695 [SAR202 cluster bacterium]|nr:hypothetical protein [SAR202 cluster bacterium]